MTSLRRYVLRRVQRPKVPGATVAAAAVLDAAPGAACKVQGATCYGGRCWVPGAMCRID